MNKFSVNTQPQSRHEPQSYQSHDSYTSLDPQHNRYREPSPPSQYDHKLKSRVPVVLHIKLSKDLVKEVRCFSDDNPELLAADFCQENNLPPELVPVVQKMIQTQFKHASEAKGQKEIRSKSPTTNSMTSSPSKDEYMPVRDNNAMKPSQFKRTEPSSKASVRPEEYREEQSHSKLVAKLDINIGPSQSRELLLFEGEDPAEVAYFFCSQNDLPNNIIEVLVAKLRNAQELYYRKKGKTGSEAGSSMAQSNSQHRSKAQLDREEVAQPVAAIKLTNSLNHVNTSEKARPGSSVVQSHSQIRSKPQIDKEPVAQPILSPKVMSSLNQVNMSEKGKPIGSSNSVAQSQVRSKAQLDKEEGAQPYPPSLKAVNSLNQMNMSEKGKPIGSSSNVAQSQSQIRSKTQLDKPEASQHVPSLPKVGNSLNQVPLSERSGRSKSPGEAVIFGQLKGPNSMHDSVHSNNKQSEKDTVLHKLEAQVGSDKTQVVKPSQLGSDDSKASDAANMYERWQNLIKERRNIQQIEPENTGIGTGNTNAVSSVGKFAVEKKTSERSKSPLGRSKTPKREVNPEEYYKLAMKSLIPSETAKAKVENIGQVERAEEEANKRKLNKKEADQLIDRLYGDALHRKANEDEYKLFELGVRPMREARDLTFKPGFWERREASPEGKARPLDEPRSPTPKEIREQKLTVQENKVRDTFTFKPYVSDASRKLLERKNRSTSPIHDRLYTDGLASKKNKDVLFEIMLEETCPFQPNVEKYRNAPVQPEPDFFKKLTKRELQKNDKKMDQMALESQPLKDPATGQDFFKPKINKDKYYYKVKERDDTKEKEKMLILRAERREKERLANASKALMEIFEQLDDDKDGYISAKRIELSNLDAKVLEALIKVFDIIEDKKLRIDFEGFERLIEDNLSAEQKNLLKHEYEDSQEEVEQETALQQTGSNTIDRSRQSCYREVDMWSRSKGNRTQRSPLGDRNKPKIEEVERVTEKNLTRHYQRLLGKKEDSMVE